MLSRQNGEEDTEPDFWQKFKHKLSIKQCKLIVSLRFALSTKNFFEFNEIGSIVKL